MAAAACRFATMRDVGHWHQSAGSPIIKASDTRPKLNRFTAVIKRATNRESRTSLTAGSARLIKPIIRPVMVGVMALVMTLLITVTVSGCGQVKEDAKRIALENTVSSYRQAIRWGYFPAAAGFLSPEARKDLDLEPLENVRVTGYEVIQTGVIGADDTAVQLVQIDYVLKDQQRLEQLADQQRWRYDPATGAWWLDSGLPSFAN